MATDFEDQGGNLALVFGETSTAVRVPLRVNSSGQLELAGDLEIGAVELKNATDDTRVKVAATGSVAEGDNALAVQAPVLGATSGAAVVTDVAGTVQQYLRGLVKMVAAKIGITIADGDSATLGATTGAAVVTDAAGTVQQYLRGLVKMVAAIISVKIDQTTPGTTNGVQVNAALPAGTNNIGKIDPNTATPTPYNVTCTNADTEYNQALPANCRGFEFQARTEATIRFAFVTGKVAASTAPFMTLKAGDYYTSPAINQGASPSTLYVASPTAGTVVEILAWA